MTFSLTVKRLLFLGTCLAGINGFAVESSRRRNLYPLRQAPGLVDDDHDDSSSSSQRTETSAELPERFNYKVQALMGNFDPIGEDDERQEGNILNAMLSFPSRYTFNVVGRTMGDDTLQQEYTDSVRKVVHSTTGDEEMSCKCKRRGTKFTKVQCEASVQSVTMINNIYNELDGLEMTVMRF
ncbi:DUF493 domain containing protein [Nitzschia inconspicua]|uniref:DUF493 domain containing protein n=1 Tax=Nitzschia inconspicua TaxID=303405 RepID=A0A9K3LEJ6_9STRA|nr:DUF493 domain containing protein [Nitzschia inconspicua]